MASCGEGLGGPIGICEGGAGGESGRGDEEGLGEKGKIII